MNVRALIAHAVGASLLSLAAAALAAPVTARFDGTVTGYDFSLLDPAGVAFDNDNPVGTRVTWTLDFNDDFLGLPFSSSLLGPRVATGALDVGSRRYVLDGMNFVVLTGDVTGAVTGYGVQVNGTGPTTSDGVDSFNLDFAWGPDLGLVRLPMVGFGYSLSSLTIYGYLLTEGTYTVGPTAPVPAPGSLGLALAALGLVAGTAGARLRALPRV